MRRAARAAAFAVVAAIAALDIGAYARGDYGMEEPARDVAVGLGALAVAVAAAWAAGGRAAEGADVER